MKCHVGYFSAEIGIKSELKTYAGGLGILAGDILKSAADSGYQMCGVTLLYKEGYFKQQLNKDGRQEEYPDAWDYKKHLTNTGKSIMLVIEGQEVCVNIWTYKIKGKVDIPIVFLDTDCKDNPQHMREITRRLYTGDRLKQEIVLGIGGVKALEALGYQCRKYHLNEGHSAFLVLELIRKGMSMEDIKRKCVFTTHTPVPAGHDKFSYDHIKQVIPEYAKLLSSRDIVNTTEVALEYAGYVNAVSKKHQEVASHMFPGRAIDSITNGVHVPTWVGTKFAQLYKKLGDINTSYKLFNKVSQLKPQAIAKAKQYHKHILLKYIEKKKGCRPDENKLVIGFGRRFASYKNPEFLLTDIERLQSLNVIVVFAGKAHPEDLQAKETLARIAALSKSGPDIFFIENYDIETASMLLQGVDVWLNTPIPPNEASGTSGMKAVLNGAIHLSTLDGWVLESLKMGYGGYFIDHPHHLYNLLEYRFLPLFTHNKELWYQEVITGMKNGAYFNTLRALEEYKKKAYK